MNAWPLDEGLIDNAAAAYGEDSDENAYYTANVIANERLTLAGRTIDAGTITKELLADSLHEVDGAEANVATGYHAIEFLLWSQDRNGTGPGAGDRPASDFDTSACSGGHCDRRAAYLDAATDLLVDELAWTTAQWDDDDDGAARAALLEGDPQQGIATILTGMGSLSYGELAGERMKLGVMLHDPEEERDCFSDNTRYSHFYDALGVKNVYTGSYTRIDGTRVSGPSLSDRVAAKDAGADPQRLRRLPHAAARHRRRPGAGRPWTDSSPPPSPWNTASARTSRPRSAWRSASTAWRETDPCSDAASCKPSPPTPCSPRPWPVPAQAGRFKVPTLRNVAVTAPYMHNGVFRDLRTVVLFYNQYNSRSAQRHINPETGAPWRAPEVAENLSLEELETGPALKEREIDALVAFMKTLTDRRYEGLLD